MSRIIFLLFYIVSALTVEFLQQRLGIYIFLPLALLVIVLNKYSGTQTKIALASIVILSIALGIIYDTNLAWYALYALIVGIIWQWGKTYTAKNSGVEFWLSFLCVGIYLVLFGIEVNIMWQLLIMLLNSLMLNIFPARLIENADPQKFKGYTL
jgi:hypothetical protein